MGKTTDADFEFLVGPNEKWYTCDDCGKDVPGSYRDQHTKECAEEMADALRSDHVKSDQFLDNE